MKQRPPKAREPRFYIADLFAGAGGFTEGFRQAGFSPTAAVEFDKWAAASYIENFGDHMLACPIEEVVVTQVDGGLDWRGKDIEGDPRVAKTHQIDVLVGGPPCQGFSPLGRMSDWERDDPRNRLWREYFRIVDVVRPKVFVIENVPELLRSGEFESLQRHARSKAFGYELSYDVLNAVNYGVPQVRRRAIIVASRIGAIRLPLPTSTRRTVRDAIGDLSLKATGSDWHLPRNPTAKSLERYK